MTMNHSGPCRVSNKFDDKSQVIRDQYQFEIKTSNDGKKFGVGRLTISSSKKVNGKHESKYKSYPFIVFDIDVIEIIQETLGKTIEISGYSLIDEYIDKEGKRQTVEKYVINFAKLQTKKIDQHNQDKANGYQRESTVGLVKQPVQNVDSYDDDDSVPF